MKKLNVIIALAGISSALVGCSKPPAQPEVVRSIKTITVAASNLLSSQQYSAEVRARVESRLGFRVGGKIIRRLVEPGQSVKNGQPLMELDASDYQLAQAATAAGVTAAKVDFDQQSADLKRFTELFNQGFISGTEVERRRAVVNAAKARLDQATAQNASQSNQTRYSTLVADADGTVVGIEAETGQVVAAGAAVLRLARDGARDVAFALPEDQLSLVKPGQTVAVRLWAAQNRQFNATVREIAAIADPVTRTYLVKAALEQSKAMGEQDDALKLGMTASVELSGNSNASNGGGAKAFVKLPLSAVFEQQGRSAVWLYDAKTGSVAVQSVQLGAADGNEIVITSGVLPGQTVVVAGTHVLQPGQKVKLLVPLAAATSATDATNSIVNIDTSKPQIAK